LCDVACIARNACQSEVLAGLAVLQSKGEQLDAVLDQLLTSALPPSATQPRVGARDGNGCVGDGGIRGSVYGLLAEAVSATDALYRIVPPQSYSHDPIHNAHMTPHPRSTRTTGAARYRQRHDREYAHG
jgi:hypothetical protein